MAIVEISKSSFHNTSFVQGEFTDDGTETHFAVGNRECCIKATTNGRKRSKIVHSLLVDGIRIEEAIE